MCDEIKYEDLPEPYDAIAAEIGLENTIKLAKMFSGERVYFIKYEAIERPLRDRRIKAAFNGYNFRQLAKEYNVTEMTIRKIVAEDVEKKQNAPNKEQISFFDLE